MEPVKKLLIAKHSMWKILNALNAILNTVLLTIYVCNKKDVRLVLLKQSVACVWIITIWIVIIIVRK